VGRKSPVLCRSKDQRLDEAEQKEVAKFPLCNAPESQEHIVLQCTNPITKYARDYSGLTITKHHAKLVTTSKGPYRMVIQRCIAFWQNQRVQDNIHMWIGRWAVEERIALLKDIPHNVVTNHSGLLREAL
jgi:hypothetical protein